MSLDRLESTAIAVTSPAPPISKVSSAAWICWTNSADTF